jgi:hypothetical protein
VQENRVRRIAKRRGFIVRRSRRRDPQALDHGQYWLTDAATNALVFPSGPGAEWGAELDEVEAWLNSYVRAA